MMCADFVDVINWIYYIQGYRVYGSIPAVDQFNNLVYIIN